ncbi:Hypothetical_protein [Hexamita inflata]|uniref:Hypothetical_protein n=1 Tax=Hexamita inflata TaxID=28002 RepID=A0AA86NX30_9EUKA|nr:Hypothetical protein HINF_LOCUS15253 [Hexamita inflata]
MTTILRWNYTIVYASEQNNSLMRKMFCDITVRNQRATRVVKYNTHAYHKIHRDISWSVFQNRQMHSLQESLAGGIKQRMSVKQPIQIGAVIQLAQLTAAVDMQICAQLLYCNKK